MVAVQLVSGEFPHPIETLERHFRDGGVTLVQAMFEHSFFVDPEAVRERSPWFPSFARKSRQHYPALEKGAAAEWLGQPVKLDDNSRAQQAWSKYTGRPINRGSGYSVRHIWGNPWDPTAFTAGWNLRYMPFWAGMLTEDQHPHQLVRAAVMQAGWELFFGGEAPVCEPPVFITNPGFDLDQLLDGLPLPVAVRPTRSQPVGATALPPISQVVNPKDPIAVIKEVRRRRNASWQNLAKAALQLQGLGHEGFSTPNVEASSLSHVRLMVRETGLDLPSVAALIDRLSGSRR